MFMKLQDPNMEVPPAQESEVAVGPPEPEQYQGIEYFYLFRDFMKKLR